MQLRKTLLMVWISATLLSGCSLFNNEEDVVKMSLLPKVENQFTPTKVWSKYLGDDVGDFYSKLRPAWLGSTVYVADRFGVIKALDVDNGKEKWSIDLSQKTDSVSGNISAQLSGGPTAFGSHIYVGSERAIVYALNTSDGTLAWQTKVAGEELSRPVVSDGLVLVHTGNGMLQGLSESDGVVQWTVNLDTPTLSLRGESAPAVAFGAAIVGGDDGYVSAVLMKEGQIIWQRRISQTTGTTEIGRLSDVDVTPVIVDGVIYALAYNGSLVAMDLRSGRIMSRRDIGSVNDIIVDGGRIYVVDQDDCVMALDIQDTVSVWRQSELLHRNLTAPVLYNGYIVVGDSEGYLHWINTTDGRFVAQQKVDSDGFLSGPIVTNNKLFVQAKGGAVYSFTL